MINAFYDLGEQTLQDIPYEPIKEKTYLIVMDVSQRRIRSEEMDVLKAKRYVWVGNRKGNQPKDRLIVGGKDALRYLIFTTVFYLLDKFRDSKDPSMQTLAQRLDKLIQDLGILELKDGQEKIFRMLRVDQLLEPSKQNGFLEALQKQIFQDTGNEVSCSSSTEETLKAWASLYPKHGDFEKAIKEAFYKVATEGISSKEPVLWTFGDEQGVLTADPGYRTYIEHTFQPQLDDAQEGMCRICNRKGKVTSKTTAFKFFKFCNTDKPGFAPLLNDKLFPSVFGLCSACYAAVLAGDRFVWENLRTKLANLGTILLPYPVPKKGNLRELAEILKKRLGAVETVEAWKEFQQTLQEQAELRAIWEGVREHIYIDFIFFKASNSAVKILKIIHEVPPSRLDELDEARRETLEWAEQYFRDEGKRKSLWDLDLRTQFSLIPTRKDTQTPALFLNYLEALLHGDLFSREALLKGFLEIARAHYFGYIKGFRALPLRTVEQFIVQTLVLQHYTEKLGVLRPLPRGGESMILDQLPDYLQSYLKDQIPAGKRWGLFLLGYVIGLIAEVQQKGISWDKTKSPPILNAVTFTGMDDVKVRRLVNYVADRMRHYLKGWDYQEGERVLAAALLLLEENKGTLPNYENTYWVLAGYGFARLAIRKKGEKKTGGET